MKIFIEILKTVIEYLESFDAIFRFIFTLSDFKITSRSWLFFENCWIFDVCENFMLRLENMKWKVLICFSSSLPIKFRSKAESILTGKSPDLRDYQRIIFSRTFQCYRKIEYKIQQAACSIAFVMLIHEIKIEAEGYLHVARMGKRDKVSSFFAFLCKFH